MCNHSHSPLTRVTAAIPCVSATVTLRSYESNVVLLREFEVIRVTVSGYSEWLQCVVTVSGYSDGSVSIS